MQTIVVVPTYNEADNIEPLCTAIFRLHPETHLLIVDDASPDGTGEIADKMIHDARWAGRLHVLHRKGKEGLGRAYIAGFNWALQRDYDAMIEMDADLSHDPMFLDNLIKAAETADVVIGSRYMNGISVINWPLRRIILSLAANYYVRKITRIPVNDCTSGYRLYRRTVLEAINLSTVKSNGYSFQVEMTFRAHITGFRIVEVPIIFMERRAGQSKMSKREIWESTKMPLRLRLRERSLKRSLKK